jgi:TolB-like protein/Flp pilus assembly protein TadD
MPEKSDNPHNFWQELKRRKVVRVVIVYAAAAYVILELVSIIAEPFGLPEWTLKLVFVLLCIGLVISIVLSWIYDVTPEGVQKTKPVSTKTKHKAEKTARSVGWQISTVVSIAIIIGLLVINIFSIRKKAENAKILEKSIAVLPFANLSNDPEQEYFSDGMVDAILDNLFKVGDLKVISRTSSMRYKDTDLTLKEIAQELNVTSILEGSVQKAGEKVRITIQLIDAESDTHLWSDSFDGELYDVFKFQSDVARAVADELKIALSAEEVYHMDVSIPSSNPIAYDFYLKGNDYWSRFNAVLARDMYSRAIEEDSLFTIAYAKRAMMNFFLFWNRTDNWFESKSNGLRDLQRALELNPKLVEVRFVEAVKKYWIDREYNESIRLLNGLKKTAPNMADIYAWTAYNLRRQGKMYECLEELEKAIGMDPFNANYVQNLAQTHDLLHQYDKMIEWSEKGLSFVPDHKDFNNFIYYAYFKSSGDVNLALEKSGLTTGDLEYDINYYTRQYDRLIPIVKEQTNYIGSQFGFEPPIYKLALIYFLSGNQKLCKQYADSSVTVLLGLLEEIPDEDRFYSALGRCYALAGKREEAIAYGERALELKPVSMDAFQNPSREEDMMEIYVLIGDYDRAMDKMEYLLFIPSWLSRGRLIADPLFDKIRNLPRFQRIIESGI